MENADTLESLVMIKKQRLDMKACLEIEAKILAAAFRALIDKSHKSCKKILWFKNGYLIFTGLIFGSSAGSTLYQISNNEDPNIAPIISFVYIVCVMVAYQVMAKQFKRTHEMRKDVCENSIANMKLTIENLDAVLENIELKIEILRLKNK